MKVCSKVTIAALCAAALIAGNGAAKEAVKVGDAAPTFEAKDDTGTTWKSSEHVGKDILIVYFFPAAMTGG